MIYLLSKTLHLLFVMAWMACVFYLPRLLVNLAETNGQAEVQARLFLMGRRLYRFGHHMFGFAAIFGVLLWFGYRWAPQWWPQLVFGGWLHAKLGLVAAMLGYFIYSGRLLKRAEAGAALPSATRLRWLNELPLVFLLPIIYLVLAKPF